MTELWPTFLRSAWLVLLLPCAWLLWRLLHRERRRGRWQILLPAAFHALLLTDGKTRGNRLPWLALGLAWLLALIALLGPSWQRMEQPRSPYGEPLVAILDLTPRMLSTDLSPSRLEQARRTLVDLLKARRGALTGIVVYAGSAHVLVPLSDDLATALNLIGALKPSIMPEAGQRADLAVARAQALLEQAGQGSGRLLLLTSGLSDVEQNAIRRALDDNVRLDIIGMGTPNGAPIVQDDGSFMKDTQGNIIIPRLDGASLEAFARRLGGTYQASTLGQAALGASKPQGEEQAEGPSIPLTHWSDQGYWLLLPLLLLAACAGRRGWLFCLPLLLLPVPGHALDNLWLRGDQQGQRLLLEGRPDEAARYFTDPQRQGYALYLAGQYAAAAERFAQGDQAADHYNRGNALAQTGDLENALRAYDVALERDPELEQARYNRQLIEELLRQRAAEREQRQPQQQPASQAAERQPQQAAGATAEQSAQPESEQPEQASATQQVAPADAAPATDADNAPAASETAQPPLDRERRQALEQWLRQIPDDPAELLRRKFRLEQQQRLETP